MFNMFNYYREAQQASLATCLLLWEFEIVLKGEALNRTGAVLAGMIPRDWHGGF